MRGTILHIGDVIQDRYIIEDVLGKGGFSAVYLVRDEQNPDARFALKELIDQDKVERERFTFECEVLERLHHPALPRVHSVFEADEREYMLMDYIEGPNLEQLRKQQPDSRFSLSQALTLLKPIMDAISYLHSQQPPIIHRDVKPSNIIISKDGNKAVLVDFGIAKEYHPDSTTTAVRHCSPGYGAPEQYSIGTNQRTDVYGLGATLYTLLTGMVPVDSLLRATKMGAQKVDPLVPITEMVPTLPEDAASAITRAMSIGNDRRFATMEDFQEALYLSSGSRNASKSRSSRAVSPLLSVLPGQVGAISTRKHQGIPRYRKPVVLLSTVLALLLILAVGLGFSLYMAAHHKGNTGSTGAVSATKTQGITATPSLYPTITTRYDGTVHDLSSNLTTRMSITQVQQNNGTLQGYFSGLKMSGPFTGVLDRSKHIYLTVTGHPPLFFEGSVRSDGNLVGNYCTIDAAGQCVGNYGLWSLSPVHS